MKVVILAGGFGTRLSEETNLRPKPMVEIGGYPILWHIMKSFSSYGLNEFIICAGYKSYVIKEYFANYYLHNSDIKLDIAKNSMNLFQKNIEPWVIDIIDTGENTMTGGRLNRVKEYIKEDDFCFTYGDGLSDVNINSLIEYHKSNKCIATLTAVQPPGRYGALKLKSEDPCLVSEFKEKQVSDKSWINGGFFVLNKKVFNYICNGDETVWEKEPLEKLSQENQLSAYKHYKFWHPMDTLRDKKFLEDLWKSSQAPWKNW